MLYLLPVHLEGNQAQSLGGKGSSLNRLIQHGFNVPQSVVLSAECFNTHIRQYMLNREIDQLFQKQLSTLSSTYKLCAEVANKIRQIEIDTDVQSAIYKSIHTFFSTETFAVRSSAECEDGKTLSYAGIFESFLDVDSDNLIDAIKSCWASSVSPRSVLYAKQKSKISFEARMAVIIQNMIHADFSGVFFTKNPVGNGNNDMVVEFGAGLGEGIVNGTQETHTLTIPRNNTPSFISVGSGGLSAQQLKDLIEVSLEIEKIFDSPQDIEFSFKGTSLYILQSRNITTLPVPSSGE